MQRVIVLGCIIHCFFRNYRLEQPLIKTWCFNTVLSISATQTHMLEETSTYGRKNLYFVNRATRYATPRNFFSLSFSLSLLQTYFFCFYLSFSVRQLLSKYISLITLFVGLHMCDLTRIFRFSLRLQRFVSELFFLFYTETFSW